MRALFSAFICLPTLAGCVDGISARGNMPTDPLVAPGAADGSIVDPMIVGDRLLAAGEPELALDSYIRAGIDRGELSTDIRMSIATANIELGRLGQAERELRAVLADEPENARAMNNLGAVLLDRGEFGEAYQTFRTAFALQPSPEIRENLIVSAAKLRIPGYDIDQDNAFTLTRRADGTYGLVSPGQQ